MKLLSRLLASLAVLSLFTLTSAQVAPAVQGFQPSGWNEISKKNPNGSKTTEFHLKSINYVDSGDSWKRIDLTPERVLGGWKLRKGLYEADIPLRADGDIRFTSTVRYSIREKKIRDDAPVSSIKVFNNAASVSGVETDEGILYPNALLGADLLLQPHEHELRYLVKWNAIPPECTSSAVTFSVPFTLDFGGLTPRNKAGRSVRSTNENITEHLQAKVNDFRGIGVPEARIWDAHQENSQGITIVGRFAGNVFTGNKQIPCSFFSGVTYPVYTDTTTTVYPNPDAETTSMDGSVVKDDSTDWATTHDAAGGTGASDTTTNMSVQSHDGGAGVDELSRVMTLFDTSSIPDTDTISAATLSIHIPSTAFADEDNDGNDYVNVYSANPASNTAIGTPDYDQCGTTEFSTGIDLGSVVQDAYNAFALNATGLAAITKTGVSKFCWREGHDAENDPPLITTNNRVLILSAETADTTSDPKLVITHTASAGQPAQVIWFSFLKIIISSIA